MQAVRKIFIFKNRFTFAENLYIISCMGFFSFWKNRRAKRTAALPEELVPVTKVKAGLALGGGGARGFGHIGVLRAFEDQGIDFDYVAGTSVGSLVGALYAYGMNSHQIEEAAMNLKESDIKTSKIIFISSKATGIEKVARDLVGDTDIKDLKKKFAAVAVDIGNGEEVDFYEGDLAKIVSASCCVPIVFSPVVIDGRRFVDGGLSNTVPSDIVRFMGADIVVGVDINSTRAQGTDSDGMLDIAKATLGIAMEANVVKGVINSDVMIRPDLKRFSSTKFKGASEMIEEGYKAAMANMDQIKSLLNIKYKPKKTKGAENGKQA